MTIERAAAEWDTPRRGRPRNPEVDRAVHRAVIEQLSESSYSTMTLSSIAKRAQVAPTTLYRRYDSVAELVVDVVAALVAEVPPPPAGIDLESGVVQLLDFMSDRYLGQVAGRAMLRLFTDAQFHDELAPLRTVGEAVVDQWQQFFSEAKQRGELRDDVDVELLWSLLRGLIPAQVMLAPGDIPDDYAAEVARLIVRGVRPGSGEGC